MNIEKKLDEARKSGEIASFLTLYHLINQKSEQIPRTLIKKKIESLYGPLSFIKKETCIKNCDEKYYLHRSNGSLYLTAFSGNKSYLFTIQEQVVMDILEN